MSEVNSFKDIPAGEDWVFWLSEQDVPASVKAKQIFVYEKGKTQNIDSWIIPEGRLAISPTVSVSQVIAHNALNGEEILWKDGFGNSILSKEVKNNISFFHFYSHIDPEWTELPWSEEFPKLMFRLIFQEEERKINIYNDKRIIDQSQMLPMHATGKDSKNENKFAETTELTHIFWIASFVIFFLERLLSFYTKSSVKNA